MEDKTESISSVELKRNSKGITEIKVKVYLKDPEAAAAKAKEIYNQKCTEYSLGQTMGQEDKTKEMTLSQLCDYISENSNKIAVRVQKNGKWGSYMLTQLCPKHAITEAIKFIKEGRIPCVLKQKMTHQENDILREAVEKLKDLDRRLGRIARR